MFKKEHLRSRGSASVASYAVGGHHSGERRVGEHNIGTRRRIAETVTHLHHGVRHVMQIEVALREAPHGRVDLLADVARLGGGPPPGQVLCSSDEKATSPTCRVQDRLARAWIYGIHNEADDVPRGPELPELASRGQLGQHILEDVAHEIMVPVRHVQVTKHLVAGLHRG